MTEPPYTYTIHPHTLDGEDPAWALRYILDGLSPQHQVIDPDGARYWLSKDILDAANEQLPTVSAYPACGRGICCKRDGHGGPCNY